LSVAINAVDSNGKILAVDDTSEENFLTQALHAAVHKDTRIKILAVAQLTTGLFEREGLRWEVSPRFVAAFLRRNGFKLRHARVGLVIEVDERSSSLAHRLYQETFGADGVRFTGCALCEEDTSKLQGQ
jgi:hypothetical protein